MAHKAVIKQNKVVDDNNINQAFLADNTKDYYDGQALTISSGEVAPVESASDVVFGISCVDKKANTLESKYKVFLRQPRTGDTFLLETDFELDESNVGTYYGIIPELDADTNPTGGYVISTTGTQLQWRLIKVMGKNCGEFEFQRFTNADAEVEANKVTSGEGAPSTTPAKVGLFYVDTDNDKAYVSTGTSSSSDWTALN